MTIELDIYCKKQPTVKDLIAPLNLEQIGEVEDYKTYRWIPKGGKNGIVIALRKTSKVLSEAYDKECIDENIALCRFGGVEIPEELIEKFKRDNLGRARDVCTFAVENLESSIETPLQVKPSCSPSDAYTIQADKELCDFATRYPLLEGADPWFRLPFGLAKFTKGVPTYTVELETTVSVSEGTLEHMINLAKYFASSFDGIVYDPDNETFELPTASKLHQQNMDMFFAIAKVLKSRGAKVKPTDI